MPPWSRINIIEASPHDPATAYLAVNRYQFDDYSPYIYRTTNFGKNWTPVVHGIPTGTFVRTVREDPERKGLLYAGTEGGVYVSFDAGENWQSLQLNLPVVPITDLAVKDNDLVASTQGRSFWILDDLALLRQVTPETFQATRLLRPADVYRTGARRFALPSYLPVGQNPPSGLVVDYYFSQKPVESISLTFEEASGKMIQTFTSGSQPVLPAEEGLNRFEWDVRYPDAHGIEGGTYLSGGNLRGPLAVPGKYRVKLTAGSRSQTQEFEIRKDPHLSTTIDDYQRQFDLLIAIRDKLSAAHDAINKIRRREKRLGAAEGSAGTARELEGVLHDLWEPRFTGFDDQMLEFPLKLNNRIAALQGYLQGPSAPTDQDNKVFADLSKELDSVLARLKQLEAEVPAQYVAS